MRFKKFTSSLARFGTILGRIAFFLAGYSISLIFEKFFVKNPLSDFLLWGLLCVILQLQGQGVKSEETKWEMLESSRNFRRSYAC